MNEENNNNTTVKKESVKKNGKAKKIIIAVIAVIIAIVVILGILMATGILDINLNKRSKMEAGVDQLVESITNPLEELADEAEKNGNTVKILNNFDGNSAVASKAEVSANIEELDLNGMSSSEKKTANAVKDLVNDTTLGLDVRYNGNDQAYLNVNGKVSDVSISGEAVYDGNQAGVRSPELNEKWLTISNADLEDLAEENGVDINEMKELMSTYMEQYGKLIDSLNLDEKTEKEIRKRYEKVLKDYLKEKSKDIESESDKVEVNGKTKSCSKLTLELDSEDIKELLIKYVETFENDEQVQEIVRNYLRNVDEMLVVAGESEEMVDSFDEMLEEIDYLKEEIEDDFEFDGKVIITVYATATKTYRTDIAIEIDGSTLALETTFNKDETVTDIKVESMKVATMTIKSDKNSVNIKVATAKSVKDYIGGEFSFEINYKTEENKNEMYVSVDAGKYGVAQINATTNINKNEDNEYDATTDLKLDMDIDEVGTIKGTVNMKTNLKTGDVSIPTIDSAQAVDGTDTTAVNAYLTEMQTNAEELQTKLTKIESLKPLLNSAMDDIF